MFLLLFVQLWPFYDCTRYTLLCVILLYCPLLPLLVLLLHLVVDCSGCWLRCCRLLRCIGVALPLLFPIYIRYPIGVVDWFRRYRYTLCLILTHVVVVDWRSIAVVCCYGPFVYVVVEFAPVVALLCRYIVVRWVDGFPDVCTTTWPTLLPRSWPWCHRLFGITIPMYLPSTNDALLTVLPVSGPLFWYYGGDWPIYCWWPIVDYDCPLLTVPVPVTLLFNLFLRWNWLIFPLLLILVDPLLPSPFLLCLRWPSDDCPTDLAGSL